MVNESLEEILGNYFANLSPRHLPIAYIPISLLLEHANLVKIMFEVALCTKL